MSDGAKVSGTIKLTNIDVGQLAGSLVRTTDGTHLTIYSVIRGDGRIIYTDPEGFSHKLMHYAPNPRHPIDSQ
jgi:hypothetical protein